MQGEILRDLVKKKGYTQEQFAPMLGVSRTYLLVLYGKKALKEKYIQKAVELLDVNINVFTNSENKSLSPSNNNPSTNHIKIKKKEENSARVIGNPNLMWVPLVSQRAYAGFITGYGDQEYIDELPVIPFEVDREYRGNYVCFEVWGDSMDVDQKISFSQGDIVLCREIQHDHWRDKLHINKWPAFVIVHDESIVIKKIIKHDPKKGTITVHSLNPLYEDYEIELADVKMIFNVVKKTTDF